MCNGPGLDVVFRNSALCISSALNGMWSCAVSLLRRPILTWPSVCAESRADPKGFGERWPLLSGESPSLLSAVMAPLLDGDGGRVANLLGPPTRNVREYGTILTGQINPCMLTLRLTICKVFRLIRIFHQLANMTLPPRVHRPPTETRLPTRPTARPTTRRPTRRPAVTPAPRPTRQSGAHRTIQTRQTAHAPPLQILHALAERIRLQMCLVLGLDRTTVLRSWHDLARLVDGVIALFAGGVGAVGCVVSFCEGPLHAFPEGHLDGLGGVEAGLDEGREFGHLWMMCERAATE